MLSAHHPGQLPALPAEVRMSDSEPDILSLPPPRWDEASAGCRIAQLEAALARESIELQDHEAAFDAIVRSGPYRIARLIGKVYDRLLPFQSRRRLAALRLVSLLKRGLCTISGRDLDRLTGYDSRDRLAISAGDFDRWVRRYEPSAAALRRQRQVRFQKQPVFGLVLTGDGGAPPDDTLRSVLDQTYPHWLLFVPAKRQQEPLPVDDPRIRIGELVDVDFVARLDVGDILAPFALFSLARAVDDHPDVDFLYGDEDRLDDRGRRVDPRFKPDWSPDTLRSHNYVGRMAVYRADLAGQIGFSSTAVDYDLALRAGEIASRVIHVPEVFIHGREKPRCESTDSGERQALSAHLRRIEAPARIESGNRPGTFRVLHQLRRKPLVSVLIPNRDSVQLLSRCLDGLAATTYQRFEVLILENMSVEPETHNYYAWLERQGRTRILRWDRPFNYAAINNFGAAHARGELLLLLNNDIEAANPDWLERLVGHALRPGIGAVGAKLLYADETVQHAGVIVGLGGAAGHGHARFPRESAGYLDRLQITHNVAAVTGACLMTPADVFAEIGGFDERFVVAYNDVDLCLQILARGYRIVCTPDAELYHYESKTRGAEDTPAKLARFQSEYRLLGRKWAQVMQDGDPYYSRNLSLGRSDYAIRA
jgi:GT2 family glycosyltransferase